MPAIDDLFDLFARSSEHLKASEWTTAKSLMGSIVGSQGLTTAAVNVRDYGAVGDGVTDDTPAIRDAISAALTNGYRAIIFPGPDYTYKVTPAGVAFDGAAIVVPSANFHVLGSPGATILQTGLGESPDTESFCYAVFRGQDGTEGLVFDGLNFIGENTSGTYTYNHQSACIDLFLTLSKDVVVRNCTFKKLWGFGIHDRGENTRVHAFFNHMEDSANGMNICANDSLQLFNTFKRCEGIEASGDRVLIAFNLMYDMLGVGVSVGGNQGRVCRGGRVEHNQIYGVQAVEGQSGIGIVLAENMSQASVSLNHVERTHSHGIVLAGSVGIADAQVNDNHLYNCGLTASGGAGINCLGNDGGHSFCRNKSKDRAITGFQQAYGLLLYAPNCRVQDNEFKGTFHDASFSGSTATIESGNRYLNGTQEVVGGATFFDPNAWR